MRAKYIRIAVLACALACASPAWADPPRDAAPDWLVRPSGEDMASVYPPLAAEEQREGAVRLRCKLSTEGLLIDCRVETESPPGYGFGDAAIALSVMFRFSPRISGGRAVEDDIRIPIDFRYPRPEDDGPPPPAESVALARRLLDVFVGRDWWDAISWSSAYEMLYSDDRRHVVSPTERVAIVRITRQLQARYRDRFLDAAAVEIARRMTPAEMEASIAFLRTPEGLGLAQSVMPALQAGGRGMANVARDFRVDFRRIYCEEQPRSEFCLRVQAAPPTPAPPPPDSARPAPPP